MLDKGIQPVIISKLHDPLVPIISPRCSLEFRILSPRSLKNSDPISGVGLGIVAALDNKLQSHHVPIKSVVEGSGRTKPARSNPVPISGIGTGGTSPRGQSQEMESESWEEYTYVTCHRPNNTYTKMYCDRGEITGAGHDRARGGCGEVRGKNSGALHGSPMPPVANKGFPTSDFLSSCYLCRKKLHGKDIYIYRGDKAFCSAECRHTQIVVDERKEKCRSEMPRSVDASSCSPYSRDNLFSIGIFAT